MRSCRLPARDPHIVVEKSPTTVGWVERSEPHHRNLPDKWWGSLRLTHPTLGKETI